MTAPGRKQVYRGPDGDIVGLRTSSVPDDREPLLVPVMLGGERTGPHERLEIARMHFRTDLEQVPEAARRIDRPDPHEPATTEALERLTEQARSPKALERAGLPEGPVGRGEQAALARTRRSSTPNRPPPPCRR